MASSQDDVVLRLKVKDVASFIADVKAGRIAVADLERKIHSVDSTARKGSQEYGGLNLWGATVGRMKYAAAGLALAAGSAALGIGAFAIKATANLEQVEIGFKTLLHSQDAADQMIKKLQDFAINTPFQMTDLEKQTQMLLGFGMAADQVIPSLTAMGDAVSAFGASSADLDSVILAMGQIATKGHLSYDELRQLNEHKIEVVKYLEAALGVHGSQLQKMIEGRQIGSGTAIPIILAGMEKQFKGSMAAQAKSIGGWWNNIIDLATKTVTDRTKPFRGMISAWLKDVYDHIPQIADSLAGALGAAWKLASGTVGAVSGAVKTGDFSGVGKSLGGGIPNLISAALDGVGKVDWFSVGEKAAGGAITFAIGFLTGILDPMTWIPIIQHHWLDIIILLVSLFPIGKGISLIGRVLTKIPMLGILGKMFTRVGGFMEKAGGPAWRFVQAIGRGLWNSFSRVFPDLAYKLEFRLLWLKEVFTKSAPEWVKAVGAWVWGWVKAIGSTLADAGWWTLREIGQFAGMLLKPFRDAGAKIGEALGTPIKDAIKGSLNWVIHAWNSLPSIDVPGLPSVGLPKLPYLAMGGTVVAAGAAIVGERGPELLNLPRGASVIPLPRLPQDGGNASSRPLHAHLYLDGRQIAEAVATADDTRTARL